MRGKQKNALKHSAFLLVCHVLRKVGTLELEYLALKAGFLLLIKACELWHVASFLCGQQMVTLSM